MSYKNFTSGNKTSNFKDIYRSEKLGKIVTKQYKN